MISSINNVQIKNLIQLQKKVKVRKDQDVFVVEGIKMFEEAPKDRIVKAFISESFYQNERDLFEGIDYEMVTDSVFKEVSDTMTPQGILAIVKRKHYHLQDMVLREDSNLVILEDLRDPGNLGTMIRTAEGAKVTGIVLSKASVDIYNPKVIRSTMGSIYRMPHIYVEDLKNALLKMKEQGISLYAAHLAGIVDYDKENYSKKCGILIGNEANGLSDDIAELADHRVKIPMAGQVESLNAAIAASLLMYEIFRQRRNNIVD